MLLIGTVLKKIVRAGSVSSMMEPDGAFRRSFFGLIGTRHDERPKFFLSDMSSWDALKSNLCYLIQRWLTSPGRANVRARRREQPGRAQRKQLAIVREWLFVEAARIAPATIISQKEFVTWCGRTRAARPPPNGWLDVWSERRPGAVYRFLPSSIAGDCEQAQKLTFTPIISESAVVAMRTSLWWSGPMKGSLIGPLFTLWKKCT